MAALNAVLSWFIKKRIHQIDLFRKYPIEVQDELFSKLISSAKVTEFGEKHDFSSIQSLSDFKKSVPIQQYEDLKPYVERLMQGEQYLLWPTETKWFAKSSGTTSAKSKFIPVTKESLEDCHYKGGKDLLSIYYNLNEHADLYSGKSLILGGSSEVIDSKNEDAYFGDLSAIIIRNLPFWAQFKITPEQSVSLMSEWEAKIQRMAEITSKEDVTHITGVPSWTMVLFERILEITGKSNMLEVWPNLELFMHGGVNFDPYRSRFKELIAGDINYLESYNASEGFFGVQDTFNNELLLMLDYGIFYEFVPEEEFGKDQPDTITLSEVETGKLYAPIISTNGGLWRYMTGDTIMFTSTHPFRIKVKGRIKSFINAFGEELIVENAEAAVSYACEQTNATIADFTAGPIYMKDKETGGHEWIIEFDTPPTNLSQFTEILDSKLQDINTDYQAKRTGNLTLRMPLIHIAPKGTFYHWLKSRNKLGGQNKVPRLFNSRDYLDDILPLLEGEPQL